MNIKIRATDGTIINATDDAFKFKREDEMFVVSINSSDIKYISLKENLLAVLDDKAEYTFTLFDKDLYDMKRYISFIIGIELPDDELQPKVFKTKSNKPMDIPKSKLVLYSAVLTSLYVINCIYYWTGFFVLDKAPIGGSIWGGVNDLIYGSGKVITFLLIAPHLILALIAFIFNIIGYFTDRKSFILTSAILYAVSMLAMPLYAIFLIIQMIFMFVAVGTYNKRYNN